MDLETRIKKVLGVREKCTNEECIDNLKNEIIKHCEISPTNNYHSIIYKCRLCDRVYLITNYIEYKKVEKEQQNKTNYYIMDEMEILKNEIKELKNKE